METEPNTENVVYLDEYPELKKKVWLRRLNAQRHLGETATDSSIIFLPTEQPDDIA
jgi:hypothetical protein